jgi:hypothetical protein
MSHLIVVDASGHPDYDDWVLDEARREAAREDLRLGKYLGREDSLPSPRPAGLCCHVFAATRER